mmetsp:Transcript_23223/g.59504  ORF Transcript_23223/g.59504 Transcript_23223/m.59504 type:complete len:243 (+) Transcript_23223:1023-1751(+)
MQTAANILLLASHAIHLCPPLNLTSLEKQLQVGTELQHRVLCHAVDENLETAAASLDEVGGGGYLGHRVLLGGRRDDDSSILLLQAPAQPVKVLVPPNDLRLGVLVLGESGLRPHLVRHICPYTVPLLHGIRDEDVKILGAILLRQRLSGWLKVARTAGRRRLIVAKHQRVVRGWRAGGLPLLIGVRHRERALHFPEGAERILHAFFWGMCVFREKRLRSLGDSALAPIRCLLGSCRRWKQA